MATKTKQSARVKKTDAVPTAAEKAQKPLKGSFYEKTKHLAGSVNSGLGDLSSNKKYMEGFGRSRNADNR